MVSVRRFIPIAFFLAAAAIFIIAYREFTPGRYNLFNPIDLTDTPTIVTDLKLRFAPLEACLVALEQADIRFTPLPDETKGTGCAFRDVAQLEQSQISWGGGITLRCPALAGLVMWERHVLQPEAARLLGTEIVNIEHFGTYACRNINNARRGQRSQHATANAVDIAGFRLADGRLISIARDWGKNSDEGRFLKSVRNKACNRFNTVLSPDYNELHRDHFHFDNGPATTCR